jgi:hypothetical protein
MPPIDVTNTEVRVSATEVGSAATIMDLTSYDATHGTEGESRTRVFARETAYIRAGEDTDEYDLSGLYNLDDTGGQNVLRTAKDTRGTVWLHVLPDGARGYRQECTVTEYSDSADADGEFVEVSFSLVGAGPRVTIE